ncbi:MAG: hypothetical protein M5R36_04010 [Deltaproteobacteria bacterium]|nr:hypothetical protein [Deltaproteobacteria bacterium]
MIQPREFGVAHRFRGMEYYRLFNAFVVGPEIARVNCALDNGPENLWDADVRLGMHTIFRNAGGYTCCVWGPDSWDTSAITYQGDGSDGARRRFWTGVGYAAALKTDGGTGAFDRIADPDFGPEARKNAENAFTAMRSVPCMNSPEK